LGWGGWWFWDPVENASFMPWLAACALMHSAIVTERRGSLAGWTILLAILGFALALLGTFLVRSGVLTSVHAFAVDPQRGVAVLVLIGIAVGTGLTLYAIRAPGLARPTGFAAVSREGLLVLNNLGLMVATGTVLVGTLYPLAIEALNDRLISVGPPFFNITFAPLMAVLLIALPLAPLIAWRRGDLNETLKRLWLAAGLSVATFAGVLLFANGAFWPALGLGVGAWLVLGTLVYLWTRWGRGGARTLPRLIALPVSVWALVLAHAGAGVFAIGATAELNFRIERSAAMELGDALEFAGRRITLANVTNGRGPNYRAMRGEFHIESGNAVRIAFAERRFYDAGGAPTTEVAILPSVLNDLYIALGDPGDGEAANAWTVRLFFNPLVHLIFLGAGMIGFGGLIGLVALARRRIAHPAPQVEAAPA
ncbi:MAG: heme lyase CcmF/NrfE family subunit, partial [Hyphomonadaceae bacterium]